MTSIMKLFLYSILCTMLLQLISPLILNKLLIKKVKAKYPTETLIFSFKTPSIFETFIYFVIYFFVGACTVPLFLFSALSPMTLFQKIVFIIFCIMLPFVAFISNLFIAHRGIVTNKRIISTSFFKFKLRNINYEFSLSDIKNITWDNVCNCIVITLKNNEIYKLGGIRNSKKCYKKLKCILQEKYKLELIKLSKPRNFYKKFLNIIKKHKILVVVLSILIIKSCINCYSIKIIKTNNSPISARTFQGSSLLCDGNILITGGKNPINNKAKRTTEIFNTKTLTFTKGPDMNLAHVNHAQFSLSNCDVVIVDNNVIETYDYKLNKFILWEDIKKEQNNTKEKDNKKSYNSFIRSAFAKVNDDIIVAGGINEKTIKIFDTNKKRLKKTLYMDKIRTSPGIAAAGDYLYIFGGLGEHLGTRDYYLKDSVKVNMKTNEITKIADLKYHRHDFTPVIKDSNNILLIGGYDMYDASAFPFYSIKKSYIDIDNYSIKEDKITTKSIPNRYIHTNIYNTNLYGNNIKIVSGCDILEYNTKTNSLKTLRKAPFWSCNWSNQAQFLTHDKILFTGIKSELDNSNNAIIMEDRKWQIQQLL